jgi:hypothetical protein
MSMSFLVNSMSRTVVVPLAHQSGAFPPFPTCFPRIFAVY